MLPASIQDYTDVLSVSQGQRPLSQDLREVDGAEILRAPGSHYLHWGTGQYAVVFRCRPAQGTDIALRCLLQPPSRDAAERAAAISAYLQGLPQRPDCFVGYRFVPAAVFAANGWRSAYVMDWVCGETLTETTRRLVSANDSGGLHQLSDRVAHTVGQMQSTDIAHGDLHPDNMLVLPTGDVRLVDYDSAYVPALDGRACLIVGPEGYAHPVYLSGVSPRPFNVHMDTFAGLVLIVSLRAIAKDLSLFQRYTRDNLLFAADDLQDPLHSPAFYALQAMGDAPLAAMTASLRAMCADPARAQVPLTQVPGMTRDRKKAPGSRIAEPALPPQPPRWSPRPAIAASTFDAIFNNGN